MLTALPEIRRIFLSPIVGGVVFVIAILSYAIGDRFTEGEFAPWLVFPGLVALFFILSPQAWVRVGLYAAAGLIAAQVVMALLGFERHGMMSHAGHDSTIAVLHILFEVGVDIALAIGFVLMLKRIAPHTYEGDVIATYDVERVLNWRLAATLMALPFYVFAVRFIATSLAVAAFGMSFDVWPVLGADLVGYFMFLPAIVGVILALTGAPRLEPDYQPLNVLIICYIALVGVLTELGVLFGPQVSAVVLIIPFGVNAILATLFPTMHVAGRLLLVNYAGLITASQYAGLTKRELSVTIIGISVVVVLIMLLRMIAQVKMNRANARTEVYLRAGTGSFAIMSEEQEFLYVSEQFLKMTEYESREALPHIRQMIVNLTPEEHIERHAQAKKLATGVLRLPLRVDTLRTKSGREIKIERSIRWFEIPGEEKRRLSVSYEDVTDKVRLEAERADQEEVLKAFVYEGPQYCFVEDEDFMIRLISEGAAELIAGKPSAELIGKDALEYHSLEDRKRIMAARSERDERLERGETVVSNTPLTFKRGEETVKVRVQVKLLHLPSGAVMRGIIFDDITEVEAAHQQAEEYLKAGTGAFLIQNERYETLYVSDKVFDLVSPEDIEDINSADTAIMTKFWPDFDDAYWMRHRKEIDALATGELWESPEPERVLTSSGEERYIIRTRRWFKSAHSGGRLLYMALQDVTEINKALEVANTFLDSQLTAFVIQREHFSYFYISDEVKRICGVSSVEEMMDPSQGFWEDRDTDYTNKDRQQLLALPTGQVQEEAEPFVHVKPSGERVSFKVKSKWIEHPTEEGRLLITSLEDVTALEAERARANELRARAEELLQVGTQAFVITDEDYKVVSVSDGFTSLLGYTQDSLEEAQDFNLDLPGELEEEYRAQIRTYDNYQTIAPHIHRLRTAAGRVLHLKRSGRWFEGLEGERLLMATFEDVTDLVEEREFTNSLLSSSSALIVTQTRDGVIHSVSQAFLDLMDYEREDLIGKDLIDFYHPEDQKRGAASRVTFQDALAEELTIERRLVDANNQTKTFMLNIRKSSVSSVYDSILTLSDITAAKEAEEKLKQLVEMDELTGLFSRRGLNRRFGFDQRYEDLGMYLIDLDHFKSVNDGYGHDAGDELLKATANALKSQTRIEGNCFRLGGEEFAVLRPWRGWKDAHDFAENLRELIGLTSIDSDGRSVQRTASIGVSFLPVSGSMSEALKLGDMALREAKALGRNRSILADESMLETLRSRGMFIQASEVQLALERGELEYFVQPIVNGPDANPVGFEALVRWLLPSGELVEPKKFVDLLYQVIRQPRYAQLQLELRRQVLEQLKDYPKQYVSFNFTLEQIGYLGGARALHREIQSILDHPDRQIVIELSEKALHARVNEKVLIEELSQLRAYGYKIALDDFGVEASNIQRLQHYPIDIVKLDRSLIMDIETSEKARKMVGSLAVLLTSLELDVTVEGIETKEQAEILNQLGLTIHQGYLYSKPVPPEQLGVLAAE